MSLPARLPPEERARLLDLIGVPRFVPKTAPKPESETAPEPSATARNPSPPNSRTVPAAPPAPPQPRSEPVRPSLTEELGLATRAPQLLLFVEAPKTVDPRGGALLEAIARLLPPHQRLDIRDEPRRWPPFALALGERDQVADGTMLIRALPLTALRGDAQAKRALWRSIKALHRAMRSA